MSYNYQLQGLRTGLLCNALIPESASDLFKEMDYSHGRLISLDENSLNESLGTAWRSVDWDCSGSVGGIVAQDLSTDGPTWCANSGNLEVIADYDEWANIQDATKLRSPAELKDPPTIACITSQEVAALKRAVCAQPALAVESCTTGSLYYVGNGGSHGGDGTWADPIGSVGSAQSGAVPGSAIILLPGTYDESGGSLLLDKPARYYSAATGSVVR